MLKRILATFALVMVVSTACGDDTDEEDAGSVEEFCAEFDLSTGLLPDLGVENEVSDALTFFERLDADAPDEIADDASTVTEGLRSLVEAFGEFQGAEGEEAVAAVQEAADVSIDELASSAAAVEEYAADNCEDVTPEG